MGLYRWLTTPPALTAAAVPEPDAVTAAARTVEMGKERITPTNESWQKEAWDFYDTLGEFRYAVDWRAEMISRVRLRVGKVQPGQDEPELMDDGPAAELIAKLEEGTQGGRAQLMRGFATQLGVPGECWLTGQIQNGVEAWRIRSTDEIREAKGSASSNGQRSWEVLDDTRASGTQDRWLPMEGEALVTRVWEPHARFFHKADSPARAARPVLRELELVNRHIQAQYLSRLASAGLLVMANEISFPVRPEFAEQPDPVAAEWVQTAREAIQTPGTAAAVIPMLMRVPFDMMKDGIRFVDFTVKLDDNILAKRDSAIRRLATQLDLPAEVLLGMGDVNHWSAWQLEESGIKVHILPMVERICNALTIGYLRPRLSASSEPATEWVVWYDASEITMRPDRSEAAQAAYANFAINDDAYLREIGFDESDKPTTQELADIILKRLAQDPTNALAALKELTGVEVEPPVSAVPDPQASPAATGQEQDGPPDTQNNPPPAPDVVDQAAQLRPLVLAAQAAQQEMRHWLVRDLHGIRITHPESCTNLRVRCPFTTALPSAVPGASGTYEVFIRNGRLAVGSMRQDVPRAYNGA